MNAAAVLHLFWILITEKRLDDAVALLDPLGKFWSRPIGYVPMTAFIYIIRAVQGAAPMALNIRSEMQSADRAMIEFDGFATFPSGEPYNNSYVFIAEVRDGLIVDLREYNDSAYSNEVFARNLSEEVIITFGAMVEQARIGAIATTDTPLP